MADSHGPCRVPSRARPTQRGHDRAAEALGAARGRCGQAIVSARWLRPTGRSPLGASDPSYRVGYRPSGFRATSKGVLGGGLLSLGDGDLLSHDCPPLLRWTPIVVHQVVLADRLAEVVRHLPRIGGAPLEGHLRLGVRHDGLLMLGAVSWSRYWWASTMSSPIERDSTKSLQGRRAGPCSGGTRPSSRGTCNRRLASQTR